MSKTFTYSVLKYVHSQFLGEELNLGIILFFPDRNQLIFRYPKNISRLKKAYKNFTEPAIKQYLKSFEERAKTLSEATISGELEEILQTHFLVRDASTLQFDEVRSVVQYVDDILTISQDYFNLYFPEENPDPGYLTLEVEYLRPIKLISDHQITVEYKNLLFAKDANLKKHIRKGIELRNARTHFKSDLVWENGTRNAVKGISFDLKEETAILDKAVLITAQLNYLHDEAKEENIRFDLLVSAPKQTGLFTAYENALKTLSDISSDKRIIPEDKLSEYASFTAMEIERGPNKKP